MMAVYPNQSWMASCSARMKLTPMQFCFPGSHDSGAYQTPDFSIVATNQAMSTSMERFVPGFQAIATRWTLSQPGATIYDQLMNGVRYLDLRVSYAMDTKTKKWTWYLIHTFVVSHLETALDDVARFLAAHPTELLIMDTSLYYKAGAYCTQLQDFIVSKLKRWIYPDTHRGKITETVDAITKQGKQVIISLGAQPSQRSSLYFFLRSELLYCYPFRSIDTVAAKQAYIMTAFAAYESTPKNLLFQLTYTLTEVQVDVIKSIFTHGSLKKLADTMNPTLIPFVRGLTKQQRSYIGMIEADDQMNADNVGASLLVLAERVAALEPVSRPLKLQAGPLPVKQGAPHAVATGPGTQSSAWSVEVASVPQQKSGRSAPAQPRQQRSGCLRSLVCCCLCCGRKPQSDDEDEAPLVRRH
eukprot:scpid84837/ scgid22707/ PI-PLC X domain-containing protein 1